MAALGNGINTAYVYDRNGVTRLAHLKADSIEWGRELCDISRPVVKVPAGSCLGLDRVHTWAHSLVIYRNGERVAEGPIRKRVEPVGGGMEFTTSDVLGWTERRPNRTARVLPASPVVTEAVWTINQAFALDNPNVLAHVQVIGGAGPSVSRELAIAASYHYDDLASLVGAGLRFTTVGRSIVLWAASTVIAVLPTLLPEKHLGVGMGFTEDGDNLGTEVTARDDDGNVARVFGPTGAVDTYYGLVGLLASAGPAATPASLTRYATSTQRQAYPAPLQIDPPATAALSCDAPFPMRLLVPGVIWPVETYTASGRKVSGQFVLSSVKVTQTARDDEKVSVSLIPLTSEVT